MLEGRPKKVKCLTCQAQHVYRANKPGSRKKTGMENASAATKAEKAVKKTRRKRSKLARTQEKEAEMWKEAVANKDSASAKLYTMAGSYKIDEVINHKKFGIGIVTNVIAPQKIEVLFEDGYKFMVCDYLQ